MRSALITRDEGGRKRRLVLNWTSIEIIGQRNETDDLFIRHPLLSSSSKDQRSWIYASRRKELDTTFTDDPVVWVGRDEIESCGEETRIEAGINNVDEA